MSAAPAPYGQDFIEVRREDVAQHGRLTQDVRLAFGTCAACASTFPIAADAIDQTAYPSLAELVSSATRLSTEIAGELGEEACPDCEEPVTLAHVAYHAYHASLRKDVVVRWRPPGAVELLVWDLGESLEPLVLAAADEASLVREAAFRADAMSLAVFLFVNDQEIASFGLGPEPKLAHVVFDLPRESKAFRLLLNEMIEPEGRAIDLKPGDVVGIEVAHPKAAHDPTARADWPRRPTMRSEGPRFEIEVNGVVVGTVGNPGAGGLSVELTLSDRNERVEVSLNATGSDENGTRSWPLPLLRAGDTAAVHLLGPGLADEPGSTSP